MSTASGPGWEGGEESTPSTFFIHTKTIEGEQGKGGEADRIIVRLRRLSKGEGKESKETKESIGAPTPSVVEAEVVDNADGTYTVGYAGLEKGDYELSVLIYNEPLKDAPKTILVRPLPSPCSPFSSHTQFVLMYAMCVCVCVCVCVRTFFRSKRARQLLPRPLLCLLL